MQPSIQISIPQPCTENWELMTPNQHGRHCALCSKTVVDFTKYTDEELITFFAQQNSNICGRIKNSQQNRTIVSPQIIPPTKRTWMPNPLVWVVPMLIGFSQSLLSQTIPANKESLQQAQLHPTPQKQTDTIQTIRGIVVDEETGEGLIGVNVSIEGLQVGAYTDMDGRFVIKISNKILHKKIKLKTRYIGYIDKVIEIKVANINKEQKIVLTEVYEETQGDVILGAMNLTKPEPYIEPIKKHSIGGWFKGLFTKNNK